MAAQLPRVWRSALVRFLAVVRHRQTGVQLAGFGETPADDLAGISGGLPSPLVARIATQVSSSNDSLALDGNGQLYMSGATDSPANSW